MRVTNRLSPILIGMLVSGRNGENFDSAPFLRAGPFKEVNRSPAAAAVSSRAGVRQFGRPRRAFDRAEPPPGCDELRLRPRRRLAPPVQGHNTHTERARNI